MSIREDLESTDRHMMYHAVDIDTGRNCWITVDENAMKVIVPGLLKAGTYKTFHGKYYEVDADMNVIDETEAWKRGETL